MNLYKHKGIIQIDEDIWNKIKDIYKLRIMNNSGNLYVVIEKKCRIIKTLPRYILGLNQRNIYAKHKDGDYLNCLKSNLETISRAELNKMVKRNDSETL
jgi:hypothetical protein